MIVYNNYYRMISTSRKIAAIEKMADTAIPTRADLYDHVVGLLIECGELETGITDHFCARKDLLNHQISICRAISLKAGSVLHSLWSKGFLLPDCLFGLKSNISALRSMQYPRRITSKAPEGFAFYGLYPECYLESTSVFLEEMKPRKAIVIGLRSIGTSLSAVVAAYLESEGCDIETFTCRPRGHPFARFPVLDDSIKKIVQGSTGCFVIIVDEGPGLSGSSIGGTLSVIRDLGVPQDKTVIFPGWLPQGDHLLSENARLHWNNCRKYAGSFETQWIFSGRLEKILKKKIIYDIGAGMWRAHFLEDESGYPAVHPHHERRKYMLVDDYDGRNSRYIAKFAGLGRYGHQNVLRADKLSDMGFSPPIHRLANGFAVMKYMDGKTLGKNDVDNQLIDFVRKYLLFIRGSMKETLQVSYEQMLEMIYVNIREGLGEKWCKHIGKLERFPRSLYEDAVVAIDGRMMPHDFLRTGKGIVKVDHIEHHSDQFFHGPQNISWDIAAFCAGFELNKNKTAEFLELFDSSDPYASRRHSFFMVAYLAYRLGYVTLAADSLHGEPDAFRFEISKQKCSAMLKNELPALREN